MNLWLALRRLLPLLAVVSLALALVAAPAAAEGMRTSMAMQAHHHAMPGMDWGDAAGMAVDGMHCCPEEKSANTGCSEGCPLMALCHSGVASPLPVGLSLRVPVAIRASQPWLPATAFASVHGTPPPEPPRA